MDKILHGKKKDEKMWAIIGGTGFSQSDTFQITEEFNIATPFGNHSPGLAKIKYQNLDFYFLPRHGKTYQLMPHEINYQANIFALKKLGVTRILALSSVGSLSGSLQPGDLFFPEQFINRTHQRKATFAGNGIMAFVSLANPVHLVLLNAVKTIQTSLPFHCHIGGTYVCIEGPHYSTEAESIFYHEQGFEVIGMTAFPEYALAKEAGIAYLSCCMVTDHDSWNPAVKHVTVDEVMTLAKANHNKALTFIETFLPLHINTLKQGCPEEGLSANRVNKHDLLTPQMQMILDVLQY